MYDIEIVTPPTSEPITLEEAKKHCLVDFMTDDEQIETLLIPAARQVCEFTTARQFLTATWRITFDNFPDGDVFLPLGSYQSLNKVTYWDADGVNQNIDVIDIGEWGSKNYPRLEYDWPVAKKVAIEWTCGYGDDATAIPEALKQAMLIFVDHYYGHGREMVSVGLMVSKIPETARDLLKRYYLGDEFMMYDPNAQMYVTSYAN